MMRAGAHDFLLKGTSRGSSRRCSGSSSRPASDGRGAGPRNTGPQFAAIVEFSDDAIIAKNLDGIVTAWNVGAEKLYGCSAEEAIGRPIGVHVTADRTGEIIGILAKIRRGESVDHFETVRLHKDGTRIDVS